MNKVQVPQKQLQQLCFLQLQLTEIEQVLESYIDLLVFYTQYSFIFDEQISEIPSVTSDPARDGGNWWNYCNSNPVKNIDLYGYQSIDGTSALKETEELVEQLPPAVKTTVVSTVLQSCEKTIPMLFISLFVTSLQSDSLTRGGILPEGYFKDQNTGEVYGPNGLCACESDAWSEYNQTKRSNKQSKKQLEKDRRKAVRDAWKQEKALIEEGKEGTREWTKAEKKELLKKGKVKGYVGHHINNVKDHPEKAKDPNNIEFVKAGEDHLDKHDGNYRNETHGELLNRE